jgi:hypothetical protein
MSGNPKADHPVWDVPDSFLAEIAAGLGRTPDAVRRDMATAVDAGYLRIHVYGDRVDLEGSFPDEVAP